MTAADYIVTMAVGAVAGAIIGPVVGAWSVRWQDWAHRHIARCQTCRCRSTRRAMRAARRA